MTITIIILIESKNMMTLPHSPTAPAVSRSRVMLAPAPAAVMIPSYDYVLVPGKWPWTHARSAPPLCSLIGHRLHTRKKMNPIFYFLKLNSARKGDGARPV